MPSICSNTTMFGINCNISNTPCDTTEPCQNDGTCHNNDSIFYGYICSCLLGFNGTQCQFDRRLCRPDTCWNDGRIEIFRSNNHQNDTF